MDWIVREPADAVEWDQYYDLRWRLLRAPWGQPRGSERDTLEACSFHLILSSGTGEIIGVGRLHFNSSREAHIRFMAVEEAWRGRGAGRVILEQLEAGARAKGAEAIVLNARDHVVGFYERHGYEKVAPAHVLFGAISHTRMQKRLDPKG